MKSQVGDRRGGSRWSSQITRITASCFVCCLTAVHERGGTACEGIKAGGERKRGGGALWEVLIAWRCHGDGLPPALQERETHNYWGSAHVRPAHPRVNKELISMQRPDRSLWQLRSQKRECTWKHIFLFFLFWIISAALMCWDIFLNRLPPVRNRLLYFFLSLGRHKGHIWDQSQAANSADGLGNKAKIQHFLCGSRKK